jgi:protein-S-isoprenylcysteine O-methyltransferase Ste14
MHPPSPLVLNAWLWAGWLAYWVGAAFFVNSTKSSEGFLGRAQHLAPLAVGFFLIFHDPTWTLLPGRWRHGGAAGYAADAVTAAGLLFAVWGRVHLGRYWSGIITLKEGHRLIRTGPYRLVRHPLYTGFLTGVVGAALAAGTADAALGTLVVLAAYVVKIRREEALLAREFGDEYARFRREVPALVPRPWPGSTNGTHLSSEEQ